MARPSAWGGEKLLGINWFVAVHRWRHPRLVRAQVVALVTSLLLHGLFVILVRAQGQISNPGVGASDIGSATEPLKFRLVTKDDHSRQVETTSTEQYASSVQVLSVSAKNPADSVAKAKDSASTSHYASSVRSSHPADEKMGAIIDLGNGVELKSTNWIRAHIISPTLTITITINPSGFIDTWVVVPNVDLAQLPDGSIEKLIQRIPVAKSGETHVAVYEFVLGTLDEKTIANLYSKER